MKPESIEPVPGKGQRNLWSLLETDRGTDEASLARAFVDHLEYDIGKFKYDTTTIDVYRALAATLRDILIDRWNINRAATRGRPAKRVYYLSMEFLIGNLLNSQLINLGLRETAAKMLASLGYDLDEVIPYEPDAGLGNGGLGRLAACYLDSMATLGLPCSGSTLRYEFGMFRQQIVNGNQFEAPDNWLSRGNPWELARPEIRFPISFFGHTETYEMEPGQIRTRWIPGETIFAHAHDILVPGFGSTSTAHLRLWRAGPATEFNLENFQNGNYIQALNDTIQSETLTKILYPSDSATIGRELRLKQEYFLVAATVQDALVTLHAEGGDIQDLPARVLFHLNDTHPALTVAELLRLLIDQYGLAFDRAWELTRASIAYTNHTVMPEALEMWEEDLLGRVLPRHLELIFAINFRFLGEMRARAVPETTIASLSLVDESTPRRVRMANLAVVGSRHVNGVSQLHSNILKEELFKPFYDLDPKKFSNVTNGIAHRRWLLSANPDLSGLLTRILGPGWITDLRKLREVELGATDPAFQGEWRRARRLRKEHLARLIRFECGLTVDPDALFDVQVKRIHEYKRQLLNLLRIIADMLELLDDPGREYVPRVFIFAGKAAPSYRRAKQIIKLIHNVSLVARGEPALRDRIQVAFLPDFRVSLAEQIYPAADLSEQISTAGMEASGTGNMKFMMNGAVTIGTLDGANVEISEEVGPENIYIFGHTVERLKELRMRGYHPGDVYGSQPDLRRALDELKSMRFSAGQPGYADEIFGSLVPGPDHFFVLADFAEFRAAQARVSDDFKDVTAWTRKSIVNTARSSRFCADRSVRAYAKHIWGVAPLNETEGC